MGSIVDPPFLPLATPPLLYPGSEILLAPFCIRRRGLLVSTEIFLFLLPFLPETNFIRLYNSLRF